MRALIPPTARQPAVPAIPPCDFDAAFSRAVASPDAPTYCFCRDPNSAASSRRFPRRRFARIANFLTGLRYRLLNALDFVWPAYVAFCVLLGTLVLAIVLGIAIAKLIRSDPPSPPPSASCKAPNAPSQTAHPPTGVPEF